MNDEYAMQVNERLENTRRALLRLAELVELGEWQGASKEIFEIAMGLAPEEK